MSKKSKKAVQTSDVFIQPNDSCNNGKTAGEPTGEHGAGSLVNTNNYSEGDASGSVALETPVYDIVTLNRMRREISEEAARAIPKERAK